MTGAELKTLRESLGLPVAWVAAQAGVQRRTVEYWESGHSPVPDDVGTSLEAVEEKFSRAVAKGLARAKKRPADAGVIHLCRYRSEDDLWDAHPDMEGLPVTAYAAMLMRLRRALMDEGYAVRISYADER